MPESKKEQYTLKNQMKVNQAISEDFKLRILTYFGFSEDKTKMSFKTTETNVNQKEYGIDHHVSEHVMGL